MRKVASTEITNLLKRNNIDNPLFHIHFLNEENLERNKKKFIGKDLPGHYYNTKKVLNYYKKDREIILITVVRDPVAQMLSAIFGNPIIHYPFLICKDGSIDEEKLLEYINKRIEEMKASVFDWFNYEFKKSTGLSILDCQYDTVKGYGVTRYKNFKILVISLEKLNENYKEALGQLLNRRLKQPLSRSNENKDGFYTQQYEAVKKKVKLNKGDLEQVYSHDYVRFFYDNQMIQSFISRWS